MYPCPDFRAELCIAAARTSALNYRPGMLWNSKLLQAQEKEGILHEANSAPFSFIVKRHATSLKVLDAHDPVAFGDEFKIKVGVRCSAECQLTGTQIEVYNHEGAQVAMATLGNVLSPGASLATKP